MTLLSICQDVADMVGLDRPSTVLGSGDETARQMLALLRMEGAHLIRVHGWAVLSREHTFTTVNGTESYAEPTDLFRYADDTAWDQSNYWKMRGSLSPSEWQFRKNAILATTTARKRYRVKWDAPAGARRIFIDPTPAAAENVLIEYVSNQYVQSSGGVEQADWEADDDISLLDEMLLRYGLRKRILQAKGIPYADEASEYDRYLNQSIGEDVPNEPIRLMEKNALFVNVPEDGYGS